VKIANEMIAQQVIYMQRALDRCSDQLLRHLVLDTLFESHTAALVIGASRMSTILVRSAVSSACGSGVSP
jgi:hypothetical protein